MSTDTGPLGEVPSTRETSTISAATGAPAAENGPDAYVAATNV